MTKEEFHNIVNIGAMVAIGNKQEYYRFVSDCKQYGFMPRAHTYSWEHWSTGLHKKYKVFSCSGEADFCSSDIKSGRCACDICTCLIVPYNNISFNNNDNLFVK